MSDPYSIIPEESRIGAKPIDYAVDLNPAQYEAVTNLHGPILVVAGAGSGKTRALVYRVAYLVEQGVTPESILLLTFTRKAAAEMLRRATSLVGPGCDRVSGGTFHSLAHELFRKGWSRRLGFQTDFSVIDRGDMEELIGQLRKQSGFSSKDKRFPKRNTLASIISKAKNKVVSLGELVASEYVHLLRYAEEIQALARDYTIYKREAAQVDLDDLLILLAQLLAQDSEAREQIAAQYQYIMVDEFQDTNLVQAEIVHLLGRDHGNVMVVGDEAQSIYSFRGASFKNIMDFPKRFPGTKIIRLEENYRSRQPILSLTNHIISKAREKYDKKLFTRREGGELPSILPVVTEEEQSLFVCRKIRELIESGVQPNKIAVLFRASRHSFNLEIELMRHDLDYVKYGGRRFLEKAHIKDLLSILRVVGSPRDGVSLARILLQVDGVGPKTASNIVNWVEGKRENLVKLHEFPASGRLKKALVPLSGLLSEIGMKRVPLDERVERAWEFYQPIMEAKFDDYPERTRDVAEFLRIAQTYKNLNLLLSDMALDPPDASLSGARAQSPAQRLVLSTIHSAKGLEWNTVFIIWATEGRFPGRFSKGNLDDLEEERRLMYVAATRAEENLFFICPPAMDNEADNLFGTGVSRFLADVPPDLAQIGPFMNAGIGKRSIVPTAPAPPPPGGFGLNERVTHRTFGLGSIVRVISDKKVAVDFDHFGVKTLLLEFAGLKRIPD